MHDGRGGPSEGDGVEAEGMLVMGDGVMDDGWIGG